MSDVFPDYLVEVVARQLYEQENPPGAAPSWEDAAEVSRQGARETARLILAARAAQSDIKH